MTLFSFHLINTSFFQSLKWNIFSLNSKNIEGLIHAETMISMNLGTPVFSFSRYNFKEVAIFMQWKEEISLEKFLEQHPIGKKINEGWHIRLGYVRQWGKVKAFEIPEIPTHSLMEESPCVGFTIARMKFSQVPRFIHWGKPAEVLVRDHPATRISLAAFRFPHTIATFSIWNSLKEMTDMAHGHSNVPYPKRHSDAMKERNRKDFHFEFTTLRFKPLSERGNWKLKSKFIPEN